MPKKKTDLNSLITQLAAQVDSADDLAAAVAALKKQAIEGILQAELSEHLGYEKHAAEGYNGKNSRNGLTTKTVLTDTDQRNRARLILPATIGRIAQKVIIQKRRGRHSRPEKPRIIAFNVIGPFATIIAEIDATNNNIRLSQRQQSCLICRAAIRGIMHNIGVQQNRCRHARPHKTHV
ncbi:MAG: transposase, partial [Myxococcota bacterium]